MNARSILPLWIDQHLNTAEIASALKLKECDVDSVISLYMNERYMEREKPFGQGAA